MTLLKKFQMENNHT